MGGHVSLAAEVGVDLIPGKSEAVVGLVSVAAPPNEVFS